MTVTVETPAATITGEVPTETTPWTGTSDRTATAAGADTVTLDAAESSALGFIEDRDGQSASITGSGPEDDFGARWEVAVTRQDDVDASGEVVRSVRGGGD